MKGKMASDTESVASDSASETDAEGIEDLLATFKDQIRGIQVMIPTLDTQINALYGRAKREAISWMTEPLIPSVRIHAWCAEHGLRATPTIQEFLEACFTAALTMDYETRILTFSKRDADVLWTGRQSLTIFDIIGQLPELFL